MDVFTAISQRKSIRAYQDRKIDEDVLRRVLEAGRPRKSMEEVICSDRYHE